MEHYSDTPADGDDAFLTGNASSQPTNPTGRNQHSSVEPDEVPLPVMFDHCVAVYEAMDAQAADAKLPDATAKGNEIVDTAAWVEVRVYTGHLTKLVTQQLRLSVPYYTQVTRELKRMGCIRQLRRGGGNAESQWELIQPPTEELYRARTVMRRKERHTDWREMVDQQIRNLSQRISQLEETLNAR